MEFEAFNLPIFFYYYLLSHKGSPERRYESASVILTEMFKTFFSVVTVLKKANLSGEAAINPFYFLAKFLFSHKRISEMNDQQETCCI